MNRPLGVLLLSFLIPALFAGRVSAQAAAPPAATTVPATVPAAASSELQLERKMLALDLVSYREARGREQTSRTRVEEAMQRLDQALAGSSLALGTLETLFDELSAARAAAQVAAERVDWQVQHLQDRMRRISFMEGEVGGGRTRSDSVAGRWRVQIQPQNVAGVFDLRLDGTVISGTYEVGTSKGSLRGTVVDSRNLRLERIDAQGGFDSVFLGTFDPAAQTITGSWTANELANGQPTRGTWSALR
jgi:hypothetical protein